MVYANFIRMNLRLLFLVMLLPGFASAQFLPANTSLQQAFIQATQENKLIFVMIESAGCQQSNDVADKGLQDALVQRQLKDHFVALRISPVHPDLNYTSHKHEHHRHQKIFSGDHECYHPKSGSKKDQGTGAGGPYR